MEITIPKSIPINNIAIRVNHLYLLINNLHSANKINKEEADNLFSAVQEIHSAINVTFRAKRDMADTLYKIANSVYNDNL